MLRKREAEYRHGPYSACILHASEDELREVAVDHDVGQAFIDVGHIDDDVLVRELRRAEADVLEDFLEQRVQAAGADVFRFQVDAVCVFGNGVDAVIGEFQGDAIRFQEGLILFDQGLVRFSQDAAEIVDRQGLEFDADWEAALQFRNEVARLAFSKGPGRDKEDMVG